MSLSAILLIALLILFIYLAATGKISSVMSALKGVKTASGT